MSGLSWTDQESLQQKESPPKKKRRGFIRGVQRIVFPSYRHIAGFSYRLKRRLTPQGRLLVIALIGAGLLSVDLRVVVIYQLFALLIGVFVVSVLGAVFWRGAKFSVTRQLPRFVTAEEEFFYDVFIENRTGKLQKNLSIIEEMADPRPTWLEFSAAREPFEEKRNLYDRMMGFYRYMWLSNQKTGADIEPVSLDDLAIGVKARVEIKGYALRRGWIRLQQTTVSRTDPFAMVRGVVAIKKSDAILVLPKRYAIPHGFDLAGSRRYQPGGEAQAFSVGDSNEFVSLRDYRPGDSLRHIHWASWAKRGKPVVKEYNDEYFVRHALVLDTFLEEGVSLAQFEEAISLTSGFAATVDSGENLLDFLFVGPAANRFTAGRGVAPAERILEVLASISFCEKCDFNDLERLVLRHVKIFSGGLLVLLQWDTLRQEMVRKIQSYDLPVIVLVIVDEKASVNLDPGPMKSHPERFHVLRVGEIQEGVDRLFQ
ncbi:DUF58 domain-containing protein [Magnetococcales bacterium HHB-1]